MIEVYVPFSLLNMWFLYVLVNLQRYSIPTGWLVLHLCDPDHSSSWLKCIKAKIWFKEFQLILKYSKGIFEHGMQNVLYSYGSDGQKNWSDSNNTSRF